MTTHSSRLSTGLSKIRALSPENARLVLPVFRLGPLVGWALSTWPALHLLGMLRTASAPKGFVVFVAVGWALFWGALGTWLGLWALAWLLRLRGRLTGLEARALARYAEAPESWYERPSTPPPLAP